MSTQFKPMLAGNIKSPYDLSDLYYPLIASPKIDGIRCIIRDGIPVSRSLKPIPNLYIRNKLSNIAFNGFDGELIVGSGHNFQDTTSGIMRVDGRPDFKFCVFDDCRIKEMAYISRVAQYSQRIRDINIDWIHAVPTVEVLNQDQLEAYLEMYIHNGYEGVMVRSKFGPYKYGRSTFNEGSLVKIKPLEDSEAVVQGFIEQEANLNEAFTGELGQTKRSTHQANKVGKKTLGAIVLSNSQFGEFNIGTGFNDELRNEIWNNTSKYIGKTVKFTYQSIGTKNKPRIPVFKGFRHEDDNS